MWSVPSYRIRAYVQKKNKVKTNDKLQSRRFRLHLKRTGAELRTAGDFTTLAEAIQGRLILNELTPSGLHLFSTVPLAPGRQISLTIDEPKRFYVRGKVVSCVNFCVESHVQSAEPFPYRVGIQFQFNSLDEQQAVARYCSEIFSEYLEVAA